MLMAVVALAVPDREDPSPKKAPPTPQDQILGEWQFEKVLIGGGLAQPDQQKELIGRTLQITRTDILVKVNGELRPDDCTAYKIDWSRQPAAIDLMPRKGDDKKVQGILKLEGDRLTLCVCIDGNRPTTFSTDGPGLVMMLQLKRIKR
jgi:uncharacterized protein (TIGR03067 family)